MPTRIIQPREKTPPCCGGIFLQNQLVFGSPVPPCTPTTVDLITDGVFDNAANWPFQDGGIGQAGVITGGQLTYPDWGSAPVFQAIDDGYFQALPSLVSTRDYTLTITKTDLGTGDPPPLVSLFFQSTDGFYTFYNITAVNGVSTILITAGAPFWNPGAEGTYFPGHGLGPTDYGVLIVIQQQGTTFDGGVIDDFSLTYEECI